MKKSSFTILVVVIMGLCAALPASAQVEGYARGNEANLALLITINRLELTSGQMRQVHDILVGILDEASTISEKREAFAQEMLRFDGSAEKLDARLKAFRTQIEGKLSALRENTQSAVDELSTILTAKQGDILRNSLRGLVTKHLAGLRGERNVAWQRMRTRMAPQGGGIRRQGVRELGKRFGRQEEEVGTREFAGIRGQVRQHLAGNRLQMKGQLLQRIVDILESKLTLSQTN